LGNLRGEENTSPTTYPDMRLLWADEFDGDDVNLRDWNFDIVSKPRAKLNLPTAESTSAPPYQRGKAFGPRSGL